MSEYLMLGIASILIVGIGAQWLAWLFKWPSIILLLGLGFLAGPVMNLIKPDEVLGPLLLPLVSLSVAIILFEGGLGLRIYDLKKIGNVVLSLVSIGVLVNGILIALAAHYILGLNFIISLLLGSILVVTGPTVIIPLLRHIRPSGKVGSVIKWEGIVIDPIGAVLALLVYEFVIVEQVLSFNLILFFLKSILIGATVGISGAVFLLVMLRKYWIPDFLHGTSTLMLVFGVYILSNYLHPESGLFAVIAMGVVLGNQKRVEVKHIISFKENLGILIISMLFIILSARLNFNDLRILDWRFVGFLAALIFVARPVSVFISTIKSDLTFQEKLFICWMAPRGIVAAAIVSIFAFELSSRGVAQADFLIPVTFLVIVGTVVIYGSTASWVARKLNLARSNPQGVLILGAHKSARFIAKTLLNEGIKIILIDSNAKNVSIAQEEGLEAFEENILNQEIEGTIDLDGLGRLITLTANDEANSLAVLHFREIFGRSEVYQLYPSRKRRSQELVIPPSLHGRYLFHENVDYDFLSEKCSRMNGIKLVEVSEDINEESFLLKYGKDATVLFIINEKNELKIITTDEKYHIKSGQKLIFLSA